MKTLQDKYEEWENGNDSGRISEVSTLTNG
jgi:hypothetical protein